MNTPSNFYVQIISPIFDRLDKYFQKFVPAPISNLLEEKIFQAEKLGTSMGRTLKIQADNMRDRHRQFVKAEAMKAPVKIIFPMVAFIFPSIFVVLLIPAVLSFMKSLGG